MKIAVCVCLVVVMLLAVSGPGEGRSQGVQEFCPVVASQWAEGGSLTGYLLGGWDKDKWVLDKAAAGLLQGGEIYRFFNLTGEVGEAPGEKPTFMEAPCPETMGVAFAKAPSGAGGLVAVGARFQALPRVPKLLNTDDKVYQEATAAILRQKGIARPQVHITQVIRVDIDGDGREEVLVSATYYADGLSSHARPGDYSVIFLRQVVKGKVVTSLLEGDFFPKGVDFGAPGEHRVGALLDLNGDGVMEIILFGRYYEGDWASVFRLEGGKVRKLFTAGCGA
jgi:hypothetical protein